MPWHVSDGPDSRCPADKPYAAILDSDGSVVGCHVSAEQAQKQVAALYANEKGKSMLNKSCSAQFKALDGAKPGTFSAVVAVYGNVDKVGDRIIDGAFDATLKSWQDSGDPIPIVLAHEWKNPFAHVGYADPHKVKSVPGVGLVVEEGHLDLDNPTAAQVYRLMQRRTLKEFSFGYSVPQGGQTKAQDGAFDLQQLDLIEFGPCLKGVNTETELLSIKSSLPDEGVPTFEERLAALESKLEALSAPSAPDSDGPEGKADEADEEPSVEDVEDDTKDMNIDEQIARLVGETKISELSLAPGVRDALGKSDAADDIARQLDEIEGELAS